MKIVIAGRGELAVRSAHLFSMLAQLDPRLTIECVPAPGGIDSLYRSAMLTAAAQRHGWRLHADTSGLDLAAEDLLVSLQYPLIIPAEHLGYATAVNLHFSPLPRHRGSLSCYWPIVGRDAEAGVTLHEITPSVDAGPVIDRRTFALPSFFTAAELFTHFEREAFELLSANAGRLLDRSYAATPQPEGTAAHRRSDVDFANIEITDFDRPATVVRDATLALVFPNFQEPTFRGRSVGRAYAIESPGRLESEPGTIVAATQDVVMVCCSEGVVVLEFSG